MIIFADYSTPYRLDGGDENREGNTAIDVAVLLVGLLFGSGEGGCAGGGGGFDDGVEIIGYGGIGLLAEVGEVENGLAVLPPDAGDELADFHLRRDGVDMHHIVRAGFGGIEARTESKFDMQTVDAAAGELHHGQRATGEKQGGIVDADGAVCVHEMVFVEAREVVSLGHAVLVGFFSKAALEDGAVEGGGGLPCFEECPLTQLGFGLAVVVFRRKLARIGAAEAGVVYLTADGAGVLNEGGFDFCHNACSCCI